MKLYGSPFSPYARKARVLIIEKNIQCEFVAEDPWTADTAIPAMNPLGKVPVLELAPGNWLGLELRGAHVDGDAGLVEFVARWREGGRAQRLHERSRFVRESARWYYLDGQIIESRKHHRTVAVKAVP